MLFSERVLFLHVPKAGGMSITRYLLNDLRGPLTLSVPENAFEHAHESAEYQDVNERLTLIAGNRHETLPEAVELLRSRGHTIDEFELVLAVARDPYDLERSYFLQMQKPGVRKRRGPDNLGVRVAGSGDFERFCEEVPYFTSDIGDYFLLDGRQPPNMSVVRFEDLAEEVPRLVAPFALGRMSVTHRNRTPSEWHPDVTPRARRAIEAKYAQLVRLRRESLGGVNASP